MDSKGVVVSYLSHMYPKKESSYPTKLCNHLSRRFNFQSKKEIRFLEIGSGIGTHLKIFSSILDGEFYGVDVEPHEVKNCTVFSVNLESDSLSFDDDYFDVIFSKSVIEHVSNTKNFLSEVKRVLKPEGKVVIMTPDWQSQMKCFYDDPTHVKPFTKQSMFSSLKMAGFKGVYVWDFMQLPSTWKYPFLRVIYSTIGTLFPESFKWKSFAGRNTNDRKFIRFSKENMILAFCKKESKNGNA